MQSVNLTESRGSSNNSQDQLAKLAVILRQHNKQIQRKRGRTLKKDSDMASKINLAKGDQS